MTIVKKHGVVLPGTDAHERHACESLVVPAGTKTGKEIERRNGNRISSSSAISAAATPYVPRPVIWATETPHRPLGAADIGKRYKKSDDHD